MQSHTYRDVLSQDQA